MAGLTAVAVLMASLIAVNIDAPSADAAGPPYPGPQTQSSGPAFFGPAPNPIPYCDSPTYFDPFPENVNPIGRMDIGSTASVTTDGITLDFVITSEGNPGTQYPGFFPAGGEGDANDQPKGVELAEGDGATASLSQPLFYSQWTFTDVDQPNEGFSVTPLWHAGIVGQAAAFGGDAQFGFTVATGAAGDSNANVVFLDDVDGVAHESELIDGRVQVDFLGAVNGIQMLRESDSDGQSGFTVGGGCAAAGAAKVVTSGPTWNGTSFDVTYELRVQNNLPSQSTLSAAILAAQGAAPSDFLSGQPSGISLEQLRLDDALVTDGFSSIDVVSITNPTANLNVNLGYNGISDTALLDAGSALAAESEGVIELQLQYTPDLATPNWNDCQAGYTLLNQTELTASAANVNVADLSDDGFSAAPGDNNGTGGVDDPTPVTFPCPPAELEIVKTVVPGPNGQCPANFDAGELGNGTTLVVDDGDVVTYCISVRNPGAFTANGVVVTDPQAPQSYPLGNLASGAENNSISYDITTNLTLQQSQTITNVARVDGTGPDGNGNTVPLSDTDPAVIQVNPLTPSLEIVKTVLPGPSATCPVFDLGVPDIGTPLQRLEGQVATYCISVRNNGELPLTDVTISDPQANGVPFDGAIGDLAIGAEATTQFDLTIELTTPPINTATAVGTSKYNGPDDVGPVQDRAHVIPVPTDPELDIVKSVVTGPNGQCPGYDPANSGPGTPLPAPIGSVVTYCISVKNFGNAAATGVVVDDPQAPASFDGSVGTLAPGAEATRQFDLTVTAATEDVNVACAESNETPIGTLICDDAQIEKTDPQLVIVKTVVLSPAACPDFANGQPGALPELLVAVGDIVTYCITVKNIGNGVAENVVITDDQAPPGFDGAVGDLAANAEATRSFDTVITTTTPTLNTACATVDTFDEVCDDATIKRFDDPVLRIVKTAVAGPNATCPNFDSGKLGLDILPVDVGDTVTYCISVRNIGDGDATNVEITDQQFPPGFTIGDLASGEEATAVSYDVLVEASTPTRNTATVSGRGPNGVVPDDSDTAGINKLDPDLAIVKSVRLGPNAQCPAFADGDVGPDPELIVSVGDVVTYCVSVRNNGPGVATNVMLSDAQAPAGFGGNIGDLDPGEEYTESYDITITPTTALVNTACAEADRLAEECDDGTIRKLNPRLRIVKTVVAGPDGDCPTYENGIDGPGPALPVNVGADTVTYCLSARNLGPGTAINVIVLDPQSPDSPYSVGDLAEGATVDLSFDLPVTSTTPSTNTATVSADNAGPDDDDALLDISTPVPSITLTNTVIEAGGSCDDAVEGIDEFLLGRTDETVRWCFEVKNTGNTPLTDVIFNDPNVGLTNVDVLAEHGAPGQIVLLPNESIIFHQDGPIPDQGVTSLSDVSGQPADVTGVSIPGLDRVEDTNDAVVREVDIELDKTVDFSETETCASGKVRVGESVTWVFTVTNTGGAQLLVEQVVDDTLGITLELAFDDQLMKPGDVVVLSHTAPLTEDIDNTAVVEGTPVRDDRTPLDESLVLEDSDGASVGVCTADLSIVKTVSNTGPVPTGTLLTYTLAISNDGPDEANGVVVDDDLPTGLTYTTLPDDPDWTCSERTDGRSFVCLKGTDLPAGETVTLDYTVTLTGQAAPGTSVSYTNTATVEGDSPDPDPSDNTDTATTSTQGSDPLTPQCGDPGQSPCPTFNDCPPNGTGTVDIFGNPCPEPPDEVLPALVVTGSPSRALVMASAGFLMAGGLLVVGGRRRDEFDD